MARETLMTCKTVAKRHKMLTEQPKITKQLNEIVKKTLNLNKILFEYLYLLHVCAQGPAFSQSAHHIILLFTGWLVLTMRSESLTVNCWCVVGEQCVQDVFGGPTLQASCHFRPQVG